ncbi:MAG: HisKA 3 protein [Chloroflexota bacterium]|nr:HisKA 3 protein [Chloroflexota bacterium]
MASDPSADPAAQISGQVRADVDALDRELAEIEMLVGQARAEAARHEQKRATAAERLAGAGPNANPADLVDGYGSLVTLTRRAVLMEAQVDVLEGKRKALARHRAALASLADRLEGVTVQEAPTVAEADETAPALSRVVLSAQEDLRREIARAMHDGPAQSLTNIVLQAQIVDRLLERDPGMAKGELGLLVEMVQQTLDATKTFIFDVRPMVLDDLGLVPTLRRSTRDRGRRAQIPAEFESLGADRRLPMDVESAVFRILDEATAAYLALGPERLLLRLDWGDELEAHLSAYRTPVAAGDAPLPEVPTGDVPDAIKQMIQDRHDARDAAVEAAEQAAIVVLPAAACRDAQERAGSIGARVEIGGGGGELLLVVPLPTADEEGGQGS